MFFLRYQTEGPQALRIKVGLADLGKHLKYRCSGKSNAEIFYVLFYVRLAYILGSLLHLCHVDAGQVV